MLKYICKRALLILDLFSKKLYLYVHVQITTIFKELANCDSILITVSTVIIKTNLDHKRTGIVKKFISFNDHMPKGLTINGHEQIQLQTGYNETEIPEN